jgi:hypothetical protein
MEEGGGGIEIIPPSINSVQAVEIKIFLWL